MGFDVENSKKISRDRLEVKVSPANGLPGFSTQFTIQQLRDMKQHHLDKAQEAQDLIDKATAEGVEE